jgi:hypothetical protein
MPKRKRKPIADGNKYVYLEFPDRGFVVKWFTFKDNDGIKGVAIKWFGMGRARMSGFYPAETERRFWAWDIFRVMIDQPST